MFFRQLLLAVAHIHSVMTIHLTHRPLGPVELRGLKLADFGLAYDPGLATKWGVRRRLPDGVTRRDMSSQERTISFIVFLFPKYVRSQYKRKGLKKKQGNQKGLVERVCEWGRPGGQKSHGEVGSYFSFTSQHACWAPHAPRRPTTPACITSQSSQHHYEVAIQPTVSYLLEMNSSRSHSQALPWSGKNDPFFLFPKLPMSASCQSLMPKRPGGGS